MKKYFYLVFCFIIGLSAFSTENMFAQPVLQIAKNNNYLTNYYIFEKNHFTFYPLKKSELLLLSKDQKRFYNNNVLKNEKLRQKGIKANDVELAKKYYLKILKQSPDFSPALFNLLDIYLAQNNCKYSLYTANQILNNNDPFIDKNYLKAVIAICSYKLKDYKTAINMYEELEKEKLIFDSDYAIIADSYNKIGKTENAIKYYLKIQPSKDDYAIAQENLYIVYFKQKRNENSLKCAYNLAKLEPENPAHYIKIATCSKNKNEQLKNYYKAKELYKIKPEDNEYIEIVDFFIAELEQDKINKAVSKLSNFVAVPDWKKVSQKSTKTINEWLSYWSPRQDDFFKSANNCMSKYSGDNLIKCFDALNKEQTNLTVQYQQQLGRKEQRETALMQLELQERQIRWQQYNAIQTQNAINNMNNTLDYPKRYLIRQLGDTYYVDRW